MSNIKSYVTGVAGRYAKAVFELAREDAALDKVSADLDWLGRMIVESRELAALIRNPVFTREEQGAGIAAIAEKAGFHDLTRRFLQLVIHNRRAFHLLHIFRAYASLLADHRGEIDASVISAAPLSEEQTSALAAVLNKSVGRKVILEASVDEDLIGGLIVQVGSRMVDNSLRTKIQDLSTAMKGVG